MKIAIIRALPVALMGIGGCLWVGSISTPWIRVTVTAIVIITIMFTALKTMNMRGSL